ncbi:MAG: ArsR family transcriptional regulator [Rhodospirillaceae bacterium]|nr:ArsR family transcriptional regulator [Rhodospirillaceae bacterium]|tara:strand:- start:1547 stop:2011 length:465 start_codon:yes stop_codon:yes gene_type:complete
MKLDQTDKKILKLLQNDATLQLSEIASSVGLSATPCWRRIQKLEQAGIIRKRVALLNENLINAGVAVFVSIQTTNHNPKWLQEFSAVLTNLPEVMEVYRLSGATDYLLRVVVPSVEHYDNFYKKISRMIPDSHISSSFAMECIKSTTALPLDYV